MSDNLPGKGLFGWFGRQVGYVKKAVKVKPSAAPPAKRSTAQSKPSTQPQPEVRTPPDQHAAGNVLFRQGQVQEA